MKKIYFKVLITFIVICICAVAGANVKAAELIDSSGNVVNPLLVDINSNTSCLIGCYLRFYCDQHGATVIEYGNEAHKAHGNSTGLPAPFDKFSTDRAGAFNYYPIAYEGGQKNVIAYCLGYGMGMHWGVDLAKINASDVYLKDLPRLTDNQELITRVLIYGYDAPVVANDYREFNRLYCIPNADLMFATQVAVWIAASGSWNTPLQESAANALLIDSNDPNGKAMAAYRTIVENVNNSYKDISFTKSNVNQVTEPIKLRWNGAKNRFEATLTDTNNMNSVPKISYNWSDPTGKIYVERNGNQITICSNEPVGTKDSPVVLTAEKLLFNGKGVLLTWQGNIGDSEGNQPLGRIGNGTRESTYTYTKVYTEGQKIRIKKGLQSTTGNLGDATTTGAVYGIYPDSICSREVARVTVGEDGYSNKTEYLPYQTYYAKEVYNSASTQLNETVYTINPNEAATDSDGDYSVTIDTTNYVNESIVRIHKRLGETDYDPEINLRGSKFKLTLKSDENQVYYTNVSGEDGICEVRNIPYGTYTVAEVECPAEAYKVEDFEIFVKKHDFTYTYTKVDQSKQMKIAVQKVLLDETVGKTDAKVSGAYFTVYTDEAATIPYIDKNGRVVRIGPTDSTGYAISNNMRTGAYYLKETTFPEGINPDALVPGEDVTYRNKIYKAFYDNTKQGPDVVTVNIERLVNIPNFGRVRVIKYKDVDDSTDEIPAFGAKLRLTLLSTKDDENPVYYDAVVNEDGQCEFIKEDLVDPYSPYTIPYGEYEITELDEGGDLHHYYFIQPEGVEIVNNEQDEKRIVGDIPVPAWLKIVKKDKLTKQTVRLEGSKYKIWDLQKNKFVEQMSHSDAGIISEYQTNEDGYLITPEKVQPGEYVIYETEAPDGYYLNDEWRLPEKEADYGKIGGKKIKVDKITTGILEDTTYPEGGIVTGEIILETTIADVPLTVNLEIYKKGEKFTGATSKKVKYPVGEKEEREEDLYEAIYTELPLEGVGYRIYAVEDTYTPDGIKRYSMNDMVADITTDETGYAIAEKLFPGEYRIEEYKTPIGYLKDENIPNVILENENQYLETATAKKELTDVRQKLGLTFKKEYEEIKYTDEEKVVKKALFGVYAKETINNYQGTATIAKNSLVELIWADNENNVTSKADLPEGKYYVKELYVTYPYNVDTNSYEYNLSYSNNPKIEMVTSKGSTIVNKPTTTTLTLVKIGSTSTDRVTISGSAIDTTGLDEKVKEMISKMNGMTKDEIEKYFKDKKIKAIAGAKYGIYTDKECTKRLKVKNDVTQKYEDVTLVTDELGLITLEDIPVKTYYIKEIEAPKGYELSEEIVKVELDNLNKDGMVYNAMLDEEVVDVFISKEDIFTGDLVPNCTFEIKDEEGNVILRCDTDVEGKAYMPAILFEKGKKYTYTEIEAPSIYDLNKEPHEFIADYDDNYVWKEKIKVENIRKSKELRVLKVDDETGEPLQGCVFSIVLLDEDGNPKLNKDGMPVYLVENGVTDENGEYLIEKAYYGTYKFIEVEAPEGYEKSEESMEGYEFTVDENSPERIDFIVTNTGDIAVITLSIIAIGCIMGITYVILKNKKAISRM